MFQGPGNCLKYAAEVTDQVLLVKREALIAFYGHADNSLLRWLESFRLQPKLDAI
jgi:hypothetical protein